MFNKLMKLSAAVAFSIAAVFSTGAFAESHAEPKVIEVQMLNAAEDGTKMVFEPAVIMANPGDTIRFLSVDKGHNAESIRNAIPEGAEKFKSKTGKDFDLEVTAEGTYAIRCTPHYGQGMVALLLVGDASANYEDVKGMRFPGRAGKRIAGLFEQADEMMAAATN